MKQFSSGHVFETVNGVAMWMAAVAASGVGAGFLAIVCAVRFPQLTDKQRLWLPIVSASVMWLCAGAIAQYGFRTNPWGWAGDWTNHLMASGTWLGMAGLISVRVFDSLFTALPESRHL